MGCVGEQGSKQFSKFGRGSCYLHWTTLWVGVVRLIVFQSVLLLSFGFFDPLYFEGSVSTENILLCRDTHKHWDLKKKKDISLKWRRLSSLWCRARLRASHDDGGAVQMPAREFKRGHLLQRGGGRDDWVTVETARRARHLKWTSAQDRAEKINGQVPAEPRSVSSFQLCLPQREQIPPLYFTFDQYFSSGI